MTCHATITSPLFIHVSATSVAFPTHTTIVTLKCAQPGAASASNAATLQPIQSAELHAAYSAAISQTAATLIIRTEKRISQIPLTRCAHTFTLLIYRGKVEKWKWSTFPLFRVLTYKGSSMKLPSKTEIAKCLLAVNARRNILENAVTGVAKGFMPALFVWGSPGLGKTHVLTTLLDGMVGALWYHHTAYSTPKALAMALYEAPESIHLFEDCEKTIKTDLAASVLRAACGAPNERDRYVTWESANEKLRFKFRGGIIMATNQNLARMSGPMQGVASRFRPIKWDMNLRERMCVILDMANKRWVKGGVEITAKEAKKVAVRLMEMVSEERSDFELDLRLFAEHALPAFAQSKVSPGQKWEELLLAKLTGTAQTIEEGQAERTRRLRQLAQAIDLSGGTTEEKVAKWKDRTELGKSIYYRHLKACKEKPNPIEFEKK